MSTLGEIHQQAMDLADKADISSRQGNKMLATEFFRQTMELETEVVQQTTDEPARSILYRSAANLALECADFRQAEVLAAHGLIGNPTPEIAAQLREVIERVSVEHHMRER